MNQHEQNLTSVAARFLAKNPTLLATVRGINFYEHPTRGDEAPVYAIVDGRLIETDAWDCADLINDSGIWED